MGKVSILGIDLAKSSFTICGLNESGKQILKKELRRDSFASFIQNLEPCLVAMEACGSSHYWARRLTLIGHQVKVIAPQKIIGFRKCNKNDKNDAYAIAIAAQCPGMEFVGVKSVEQQDIQSVFRIRSGLVKRQTALTNEMRGLLAEYGVIVPEGICFITAKLSEIASSNSGEEFGLSKIIVECSKMAHEELIEINGRLKKCEQTILTLTNEDDRCKRLQSIPGVGPLTAATIVSSIVDVNLYKNGRQFAASIGLTPRHTQTGGKDSKPVLLGITKHGDPILRSLLVQGGMTVAAHCKARHNKRVSQTTAQKSEKSNANALGSEKSKSQAAYPTIKQAKKKAPKKILSSERESWMLRLINEKGLQKTAVAIANRNARIIHSILKHGGSYIAMHTGVPPISAA